MLVEVRPTPSGRKLVAKQAGTADEAIRLRHEAAVLEVARHPGVVEVLGFDGDAAQPTLLTSHVDGPSLAAAGALTAEEIAGVLAAVAATLADLHQLGVVHGAVSPEHVVLAPDGSPVLCGFGHGGRVGEQPPGAGEPLDPAGDVFDLGRLAHSLSPPDSGDGRALRRLAEGASVPDPTERPTARALAGSISAAVPGSVPRPAPRRRVRYSSSSTPSVAAPCHTSSGENACTWTSGSASLIARTTSR